MRRPGTRILEGPRACVTGCRRCGFRTIRCGIVRLATSLRSSLTSAAGTRPSFETSDASIVAILALRMTDGTGRPAIFRLATGTSSGQPRFFGAGNHDDPQQPVHILESSRRYHQCRARLPSRAVRVRERHLDGVTSLKGSNRPWHPLPCTIPQRCGTGRPSL